MKARPLVFAVALAVLGLIPAAASAKLISYDFTVTATDGPLSGQSAAGSFSFDSSVIPAMLPGQVNQTGLLSSLAFTWHGISYDSTTANTGALAFEPPGRLLFAFFGNDCIAGDCFLMSGTEGWVALPQPFAVGTFNYTFPGELGLFDGTIQTRLEQVPEPGTLGLIALALGLGLSIARGRRAGRRPLRLQALSAGVPCSRRCGAISATIDTAT